MNKPTVRSALLYAVLVGGVFLLDLGMDRLFRTEPESHLPHILLAALVVLASFILLSRAMETRRRAEAVLRQARDELAVRVRERTAELQQTNEALQAEIVERHRVEQALLQVNQRLEFTQIAAGVGTWDWDIPSGRLEWSSKMFELFGLDMQTTVASFDVWRSVLHPEDREEAEKRIDLALKTRSDLVNEYRIIWPDGQVRWINALGSGLYDEQGRPTRMSGVCLDITERKRVEARIERLSSFPQINPNPVLEIDASGTIAFCNPATTRTLERLGLGGDCDPFFPDDLAVILQALGQKKESGFQREVQVGSAIFAETVQVIPAFKVVRIYAFDITERKRAEEGLRASEERFATVFHNSPDAIGVIKVADGTLLDVNDAFTKLLGYARSDVVGESWSGYISVPGASELNVIAKLLLEQGRLADYEFDLATREGNVATVLLSLVPITVGGEPCVLAMAHDITKRKRSEEALRRVQAELAVGIQERASLEERQRLARELHDSVSQALYGISLGAHTALALIDRDTTKVFEALNYVLSQAEAGLTEMRALIFELRPESLEMEGLVNALTKQTAALRARHDLEVELSVCEEPDVPLAVKEALYRIAQEALHNAVKHAQSSRLDVCLTREPGNLSLEVRDNGNGFDPLAAYPGHLGLRSMRERAMSVGGTLEIVSAPDCGTQIRARVPIPEAQAVSSG